MTKYDWHSLPEDDYDGAEVLPVSYVHTHYFNKHMTVTDGEGYWCTESSYDANSPIWDGGEITSKPDWAVHFVWFNK